MARIIITDSTSDLPPDFVQQHGIHTVPLNIHLQDVNAILKVSQKR